MEVKVLETSGSHSWFCLVSKWPEEQHLSRRAKIRLCIYLGGRSVYDISRQPLEKTQRLPENAPLWSVCVCGATMVSTINRSLHPLLQSTREGPVGPLCLLGSSRSLHWLFHENPKHNHGPNAVWLNSCWYFWVSESLRLCYCCWPPPTPTPNSKNHSKVRPQIQTSWSEPYAKDVKHPGSSVGQLDKQTERGVNHGRSGSRGVKLETFLPSRTNLNAYLGGTEFLMKFPPPPQPVWPSVRLQAKFFVMGKHRRSDLWGIIQGPQSW